MKVLGGGNSKIFYFHLYVRVSLNGGIQNTPKWSFLVGKPMVVGYHHFRKPPCGEIIQFDEHIFSDGLTPWATQRSLVVFMYPWGQQKPTWTNYSPFGAASVCGVFFFNWAEYMSNWEMNSMNLRESWFMIWVVATQIFLIFIPILGEMIQFDEHVFQMGWNHLVIYLKRSLIFSCTDCHGHSFYVSCLHWWTNISIFFMHTLCGL